MDDLTPGDLLFLGVEVVSHCNVLYFLFRRSLLQGWSLHFFLLNFHRGLFCQFFSCVSFVILFDLLMLFGVVLGVCLVSRTISSGVSEFVGVL
jgi:hypothetical protein